MEKPNLAYIEKLAGGDSSFQKELISVLKDEFPSEKNSYFRNLKDKKYKEASESVHKLKHKISILGLTQSYSIASDHENALSNRNENFTLEFNAILDVITNYLNEL